MEGQLAEEIRHIMLQIPNIIDPSVPIGPDDSCNVEVERFGEAKVPDYPIPYHTEIMESFDGIDLDAAGRVSATGSTTSWGTSPGSTRPSWPTPGTS